MFMDRIDDGICKHLLSFFDARSIVNIRLINHFFCEAAKTYIINNTNEYFNSMLAIIAAELSDKWIISVTYSRATHQAQNMTLAYATYNNSLSPFLIKEIKANPDRIDFPNTILVKNNKELFGTALEFAHIHNNTEVVNQLSKIVNIHGNTSLLNFISSHNIKMLPYYIDRYKPTHYQIPQKSIKEMQIIKMSTEMVHQIAMYIWHNSGLGYVMMFAIKNDDAKLFDFAKNRVDSSKNTVMSTQIRGLREVLRNASQSWRTMLLDLVIDINNLMSPSLVEMLDEMDGDSD